MKQTAIQQAIVMVRDRMESMNETLMGKHTAHHLQQIERGLYNLIEEEKEQIVQAHGHQSNVRITSEGNTLLYLKDGEQYYNEIYKTKTK